MKCIPLIITSLFLSSCAVKKYTTRSYQKDNASLQTIRSQQHIKDSASSQRSIYTTQIQHFQDSSSTHLYTFARPVTLHEINTQAAPVQSLQIITHQQQQTNHTTQSEQLKTHHTLQVQKKDSTTQKTHSSEQLKNTHTLKRQPNYNWILIIGLSIGCIIVIVRKIKQYL